MCTGTLVINLQGNSFRVVDIVYEISSFTIIQDVIRVWILFTQHSEIFYNVNYAQPLGKPQTQQEQLLLRSIELLLTRFFLLFV